MCGDVCGNIYMETFTVNTTHTRTHEEEAERLTFRGYLGDMWVENSSRHYPNIMCAVPLAFHAEKRLVSVDVDVSNTLNNCLTSETTYLHTVDGGIYSECFSIL